MFEAENNPPQAARHRDSGDVGSLQNKTYLAVGCFVVLTANISQESKLVNGSVGTVRGFCLKSPPPAQPEAVIVEFPDYAGAPFFEGAEKRCWVPIEPRHASWKHKKMTCTRKGLPLKPAYAWTIHKCQGQTIKDIHVVFESSPKNSDGLLYVPLSRCQEVNFLAMVGATKDKLLRDKTTNKALKSRIEEEERLTTAATNTKKYYDDNKHAYDTMFTT